MTQEASAAASRKLVGGAFRAMSHGNKDFDTCKVCTKTLCPSLLMLLRCLLVTFSSCVLLPSFFLCVSVQEYKDGGLAPDDPFHRIKTEKFNTPFTPSSPAKSHRQLDTLEAFPQYQEDPIASKVAAARQELADNKAKQGPTFKPTSGPKSSRTRPVSHGALGGA